MHERGDGRKPRHEVGVLIEEIRNFIRLRNVPRLGPDEMDDDPALPDVIIQQLQQQPAAIAKMLLIPNLRVRLSQILRDQLAKAGKVGSDRREKHRLRHDWPQVKDRARVGAVSLATERWGIPVTVAGAFAAGWQTPSLRRV